VAINPVNSGFREPGDSYRDFDVVRSLVRDLPLLLTFEAVGRPGGAAAAAAAATSDVRGFSSAFGVVRAAIDGFGTDLFSALGIAFGAGDDGAASGVSRVSRTG
jgi:hypothetical protein